MADEEVAAPPPPADGAAVEGEETTGEGDGGLPGMNETFLKILKEADDDDDDELCEACRYREMQLLAAAMQAARTRKQAMDEEDALVKFMNEDCDKAHKQLQDQRVKAKQLQHEILDMNQHLVEQRQGKVQIETQEATVQESGNYLLYKRPPTAEVNREKQRTFRDQLTAQISAKQQKLSDEKQVDLDDSNRFNSTLVNDMAKDVESERARELRKKRNYRLALEAQMAARVVGESGASPGQPWWARRKEFETEGEHSEDQNRRVARQHDAIRRLEEFKEKEETDKEQTRQAAHQQRQLVLQQLRQADGIVDGQPTTGERIATERAERQRLAEEAWTQANNDNRKKFDILEHDRGGFVELLRKYRRCRKCQKPIGLRETQVKTGNEKYWYDLTNDGAANDGGASDMPPKRHQQQRVMSRHVQLQ